MFGNIVTCDNLRGTPYIYEAYLSRSDWKELDCHYELAASCYL